MKEVIYRMVPCSILEHSRARKGKAPLDAFTGANPEMHFDDWLPALQCACLWNGWSEGEELLQFADHLQGKALQECNLMSDEDKSSLTQATAALRE